MKHSFNIIRLLVALILMMGLFNSCTTHNSKRHAKKHGLVTRGCQGYGYHKKHFMN